MSSLLPPTRELTSDDGVLIRKTDDLEIVVFENDPDSWMAEVVSSNPVSGVRLAVWRSVVRNLPPGNAFHAALAALQRLEAQRRVL